MHKTHHLDKLTLRISDTCVFRATLFAESILQQSLQSFKMSLTNMTYLSDRPLLQKLISDVLAGSAHIDDLFPHFLSHTRKKYPATTVVPQLEKISDLTQPHMWSVADFFKVCCSIL